VQPKFLQQLHPLQQLPMSYTRKVIYISLGLLIAVTLISAIPGVASSSGRIDGLEVGLVALGFSLLEAFVLIIAAIGILIIKPSSSSTIEVALPDDVLDASGPRKKPLTHRRRAGAFFAAAGIVVLVGGSLCFGGLGFGSIDVR
jgi:hypothetical protein